MANCLFDRLETNQTLSSLLKRNNCTDTKQHKRLFEDGLRKWQKNIASFLSAIIHFESMWVVFTD